MAKTNEIKLNMPNIAKLGLQSPGARKLVTQVADQIAKRAAARVGWAVVSGNTGNESGGRMRREDDATPERVRAAILAQHPNAASRKAGREALRSAMGSP